MSRKVYISLKAGYILSVCAAVLLAGSCKRRPLTDAGNNVFVNIGIERDIVNYTLEEDPSMMRVVFFENGDGGFSSHSFLPAEGGKVTVTAGQTYHVLAYNFDTEATVVGEEYDWHGIYATTNEVSSSYRNRLRSRATKYDDEKIVYEPDHHFVARLHDTYIPLQRYDAPPIILDMTASTIVETWKVYIDRVRGREYVAGIAGVMSGLALSNTLAADEESEETASVFLESVSLDMEGKVEITFNTFGYNPEERQILTLVLTDTAGQGHEFNIDVSGQFPDNEEQIIRIDTDEITIDEPDPGEDSGGGLAPDVDEWENIVIDIII